MYIWPKFEITFAKLNSSFIESTDIEGGNVLLYLYIGNIIIWLAL